MDHNSNKKHQLEFGELENNFDDTYISDDCIEFPPFWPKHEININGGQPFIQLKLKRSSHTKHNENTIRRQSVQQPTCSGDDVPTTCTSDTLKELSKETNSNQACNHVDVIHHEDKTEPVTEKNSENTQDISIQVEHHDASKAGGVDCKVESLTETTDSIASKSNTSDDKRSEKIEHTELNGHPAKNVHDKLEKGGSKKFSNETMQSNTSWAGVVRNNEQTVKLVQMNGNCEHLVQCDKVSIVTKQTASKPSNESSSQNRTTPAHKENNKPRSLTVIKPEDDPIADRYAEKLLRMNLIFKPQAFIPRGLVNTSNWCYINATLQALLVCPPFYQLLKCLPLINPDKRTETSTPIMDSFIQLVSEYRPLSAKRGYQSNKEVRHGSPFQPVCIYDMLVTINSSLSESGRQEDAEEFLSCVLNGIHDEMTQLLKYYCNISAVTSEQSQQDACGELNGSPQDGDQSTVTNGSTEDTDEWEEVGKTKRNRSAVTRRASVSKTPISEMFRGELCTTVFRPGRKSSISYEPFFLLPLDVPSDHAWTVDKALHSLTEKEAFIENDLDNDAFRQETIEILPPVLILHLKRFVYNKSGGSKKIEKKVEFKTDLVIGKELLSKSSRKYSLAQRSYKLFAVVYHHGENVTGGHYSADVFQIGLSSWLRIDDKNIWPVPRNEVVKHNSNRTAYLLYYRRTDLG